MAEAKNVTFDSIMADLKARKFVPLYYLMGEEPYYIDRIADYIAARISGADCERGAEREADGGAGEVFQVADALYDPCDVP